MPKASLSRNLLVHALLTAAFTAVLSVLLAIPLSADERMMKDTDLRGSDFTSLIARNEFTCLQACTANEQCRAWTFVARGSKCFLKNAVPAPAYCSFCVSGVVQVEDAAPAPTPPAPPPAETPPPPPPDADSTSAGPAGAHDVQDPTAARRLPDGRGMRGGHRRRTDRRAGSNRHGDDLSVQGPWHEVVISGGRHGFVYSGEGYQSLECK